MRKASIFFVLAIVFCASAVQAENIKSSEFLKLSKGQQHWWYNGAYTALGHLVLLHDKKKGKCIWNWFYNDPDRRKAQLIKSFKLYPNYTPTSIVIGLLRKECGTLLPQAKK